MDRQSLLVLNNTSHFCSTAFDLRWFFLETVF